MGYSADSRSALYSAILLLERPSGRTPRPAPRLAGLFLYVQPHSDSFQPPFLDQNISMNQRAKIPTDQDLAVLPPQDELSVSAEITREMDALVEEWISQQPDPKPTRAEVVRMALQLFLNLDALDET